MALFNGCSTDFDLVGDYQDRAVVYALLDPDDNPANGGDGHFFRIQKMFLGQASAFDMALVPDSNYFDPAVITVNLLEFGQGNTVSRFPMDTVTIDGKETGDPDDNEFDFFGPKQRLYVSVRNIDPAKEYGLEVIKTDPATQDTTYMADSRTFIVNKSTFRFLTPSSNAQGAQIPQVMDLFSPTQQTFKDYSVRFNTAKDAPIYEVWFRFHYREIINGTETAKSVEWRAGTLRNAGLQGGQTVQSVISGENIIRRIGELVPLNPDAVRIIGIPRVPDTQQSSTKDVDIVIRMGGRYLADFMEINSPDNTGAVQDRPTYTNINNGVGLLSSRTTATFEGVYFNDATLTVIESSPFTVDRNFQRQ